MLEVPVLLNFDQNKPIGILTINEDAIPTADVNYVFSIGYRIKDAVYDEKTEDFLIKKHELTCVSLQTDKQYLEYLKKERKI